MVLSELLLVEHNAECCSSILNCSNPSLIKYLSLIVWNWQTDWKLANSAMKSIAYSRGWWS